MVYERVYDLQLGLVTWFAEGWRVRFATEGGNDGVGVGLRDAMDPRLRNVR